ncbi:hypothetical protein PsorP6_000867 [Peronosclerospora sorghi]|uniref:Uncharacterized protein n=1 Tax=Peronosclerospora sorghi TaxID=230839 RepID=A0ACC0WTG9_9STRA|nr:hypothetical protein PsorP6_000867 [Peronosclerospora sorghi]
MNEDDRPHYSVGRTESGYSDHVYPSMVTYLSKIAPIPRSTTCMLAVGTHRVEDDPIIRFVPYFSPETTTEAKGPHMSTTERCKETLVGMDDEVNEFVLRYVVKTCGGDQRVFVSLQRIGAFLQPFANYANILDRVTRLHMWKKLLHNMNVQRTSTHVSDPKKRIIAMFLKRCQDSEAGASL